ncbi:MAG: DNA-3-methyladenine glycosylase I, partial [Actinobacteria bacterium]|nr:DNA-3-methyladenine glycosylase I [Actinomycetota bacterium]
SPSEYGCHVRDVFRLFDFRLELMLTQDDPMFPNWDQDETAINDRYDLQDPLNVRREIAISGDLLADRFDAITASEWLMKNEGIVRNRMKIEATIANAKATLRVQDELDSLSTLIWSFAPKKPKRAPRTLSDIPATSPESVALSKELLKRGFKFVGPTTMYAAMQSLGLVNDHLATCFVRDTTK